MTAAIAQKPAHYPSPKARIADLYVHLAGLGLALVGGAILLGLALMHGSPARVAAVAIYVAGALVMLALSTAYNFAKASRQPLLRRLDQAGVFLMIAGSYTPFTTQILHGAWAIGMTAAVWLTALAGIAAKLLLPQLKRLVFLAIYLSLGWFGLLAIKPLGEGAPWVVLALLLAGGAAYSIGVLFFLAHRLTFRRAIWHGHVVAAAGAHWLAILVGVVIAPAVR